MNRVDSDRRKDDEIECVVKGSSIALSTFYRIARNTMAVWFPSVNSSTTLASAIDPEEVFFNGFFVCVESINFHHCAVYNIG